MLTFEASRLVTQFLLLARRSICLNGSGPRAPRCVSSCDRHSVGAPERRSGSCVVDEPYERSAAR